MASEMSAQDQQLCKERRCDWQVAANSSSDVGEPVPTPCFSFRPCGEGHMGFLMPVSLVEQVYLDISLSNTRMAI